MKYMDKNILHSITTFHPALREILIDLGSLDVKIIYICKYTLYMYISGINIVDNAHQKLFHNTSSYTCIFINIYNVKFK